MSSQQMQMQASWPPHLLRPAKQRPLPQWVIAGLSCPGLSLCSCSSTQQTGQPSFGLTGTPNTETNCFVPFQPLLPSWAWLSTFQINCLPQQKVWISRLRGASENEPWPMTSSWDLDFAVAYANPWIKLAWKKSRKKHSPGALALD